MTHDLELAPPDIDHRSAWPRHARWLLPALAAVAVAAVAVAVSAITTSGNSSAPKPNPPASQVSTSTPSTTMHSTPTPTTTAPAAATPTTPPSHAVPALLRNGAEQGRAQIPWSQVGGGWYLAAPYNATSGARKGLYLINPIGGRYLITDHLPDARDAVVAWSPDGTRAMLVRWENNEDAIYTELELATGRVLHTFNAGETSFISYTRPQGQAILVSRVDGKKKLLQRLGTDGSHQLTYPGTLPGLGQVATDSRSIYTADGGQLLVGGANGIALLGNDGHLIRPLPAPPSQKSCMPLTWWDPATALVSCTNEAVRGQLYSYPTELFLQPVAGGTPTKLAGGSAETHPFGFVYAWKYSGGVVLREGSGCGPGELDVLRNGVISRLRLPAGVVTPAPVFGFDNDSITVLQRSVCGPAPDSGSVISFNLATGATSTLFKGTAWLTPYPWQQP